MASCRVPCCIVLSLYVGAMDEHDGVPWNVLLCSFGTYLEVLWPLAVALVYFLLSSCVGAKDETNHLCVYPTLSRSVSILPSSLDLVLHKRVALCNTLHNCTLIYPCLPASHFAQEARAAGWVSAASPMLPLNRAWDYFSFADVRWGAFARVSN